MRRSRRPLTVDPAARDLIDGQRPSFVPGSSTTGRVPPILRGKRPSAWGWVLVVMGLVTLAFAVPNIWESVTYLRSDGRRAVELLVGTSWLLFIGTLMTASGVAIARRPRRRR